MLILEAKIILIKILNTALNVIQHHLRNDGLRQVEERYQDHARCRTQGCIGGLARGSGHHDQRDRHDRNNE